jgi:hypothetical protein
MYCKYNAEENSALRTSTLKPKFALLAPEEQHVYSLRFGTVSWLRQEPNVAVSHRRPRLRSYGAPESLYENTSAIDIGSLRDRRKLHSSLEDSSFPFLKRHEEAKILH